MMQPSCDCANLQRLLHAYNYIQHVLSSACSSWPAAAFIESRPQGGLELPSSAKAWQRLSTGSEKQAIATRATSYRFTLSCRGSPVYVAA